MSEMLKMPKHVWSLWNLGANWENCSFLLPNQLKLDKSGIQGIVGKDQRKGWSIMQMSYLVND